MKKTTRTIYGSLLDTARRFNDPLKVIPNSTLNEKFNVYPDEKPGQDEYPQTQYFAIGLKGAILTVSDNMFITTYRSYDPSWASLLGHVPFVMRRENEDLSQEQRGMYRMRAIQTFGGVRYICYYLKKLDTSLGAADVEQRELTNGSSTSSPWEPSGDALNPVPLETSTNVVTVSGDKFLTSFKKVKVEFTPFDIQEIMNACNIIHGNPDLANINELALVSGIERDISNMVGGSQVVVREAVYAQITDFVKTSVNCPEEVLGKVLFLDAGSNEPVMLAS